MVYTTTGVSNPWTKLCCVPTDSNLIARPHPLTRRNCLVKQVEFLGLTHALVTMYPSNIERHFVANPLKTVQVLEWRLTNFTGVTEVLRHNYPTCNPIGPYHFWGISPRNSTSFTRLLLTGRCAWAGHKITPTSSWLGGFNNFVTLLSLDHLLPSPYDVISKYTIVQDILCTHKLIK